MSWHSSVVRFRRRATREEMDKADKSNRKQGTRDEEGTEHGADKFYTVYLFSC